MKRREALKNIGLSAGFVLATPSIVSLLQSCTSDAANWVPQFFTEEQGVVLRGIVDTILPKTDTPSGTEVNVPEFMDKFVNEVSTLEEQAITKDSYAKLVALIKADYNENLSKLTTSDYENLLDTHMKLRGEDAPDEVAGKLNANQLLNNIKGMSIWAYKISENVGENVLAYDPVPSSYHCGDLQELTGGKSWSL